MSNDDLPWALSEIRPFEFVTAKDMSPERLERAREEALIWAKQVNEGKNMNRRKTDQEREAERNFQFYEEEPVPVKKEEKEPVEDYEGCGCSNCELQED